MLGGGNTQPTHGKAKWEQLELPTMAVPPHPIPSRPQTITCVGCKRGVAAIPAQEFKNHYSEKMQPSPPATEHQRVLRDILRGSPERMGSGLTPL